jgi:hypothetical protein
MSSKHQVLSKFMLPLTASTDPYENTVTQATPEQARSKNDKSYLPTLHFIFD